MDFLQSAWNGHLQGKKNVKRKENAKQRGETANIDNN